MLDVSVFDFVKAVMRGDETALIDVREQWEYCQGHALLASNCPLSSLELQIDQHVPCRRAHVVVMDDGARQEGGLAIKALQRLQAMGYLHVHRLAGGLPAWQAAGYHVFTGIHVIGKLFGEIVEHQCHTPTVMPQPGGASAWESGAAVLVDIRPRDEFERATVPGSINVPVGELLRSDLRALHSQQAAPLIVHCGGRTRGIIAGQTVAEADPAAAVTVLCDGTIGWRLTGGQTVGGRVEQPVPLHSPDDVRRRAATLLDRAGIARIPWSALAGLDAARLERTVYYVDVRSPEEYAAAHRPLAVGKAAGQLLQEMDALLAVRNAEIVLFDDLGDRAAIAGYWLHQAGWRRISWVSYDECREELVAGEAPQPIPALDARVRYIGIGELAGRMRAGPVRLIDLSSSVHFEEARIPGAIFAIRSMLEDCDLDAALPGESPLVLTCEDGRRAALAACDLAARHPANVCVLQGGNQAWRRSGLAMQTGAGGTALHPPHDVRRSIYDTPSQLTQSMRSYIEWETALPAQATGEEYLRFFASGLAAAVGGSGGGR